jgi:D-glycero-D-manno-heptose 1,7-bisphosphate phosphatase
MADDRAKPAIFLDRDGVIVVPEFRDGRSFAPTTLAAFRLYDSAPKCLQSFKDAGFLVVVVTNQPDVGKGTLSPAVLNEMHRRMRAALPIDDIQVCAHSREDACLCRKPGIGMLTTAAAVFGIALDRSYMIGDREGDIVAGRTAGCRTVFIDLEYAAEPKPKNADFVVRSLEEATDRILADAKQQGRGNVSSR